MSNKKSIFLTLEEVELILSCFDTSIIYLHDCSSRFKLLKMSNYLKPINRGIKDIYNLSTKFNKLYNKFDLSNSNYLNNDLSILDLMEKLLN